MKPEEDARIWSRARDTVASQLAASRRQTSALERQVREMDAELARLHNAKYEEERP